MSADRKSRSDSKLKNLPQAEQARIADLLRGTGLREAVKVLRERGIITSRAALGRFFQWWNACQQDAEMLKAAGEIAAKLRLENPKISESDLKEHARKIFMLQIIGMASASNSKRFTDAHRLWEKVCREAF